MKRNGPSGVNSILITGVLGFLGSNLAKRVVKDKNFFVYGVDFCKKDKRYWILSELTKNKNFKFYNKNLLKSDLLEKNSFDYIVHCAGFVDSSFGKTAVIKAIDCNVKLTARLLEAVKEKKIKRFIHISTTEGYKSKESCLACGQGGILPSPYAITKYSSEMFVRTYSEVYGFDAVVLRLSNLYGPYQNVKKIVPMIISKSLADKDIVLKSSLSQGRDFCFVDDAVSAVISSLKNKKAVGKTLNIVSGKNTSLGYLVKVIIEKTKSKSKVVSLSKQRLESARKKYSYSLTTKTIGWKPKFSIDKGIEKTISWHKKQRGSL